MNYRKIYENYYSIKIPKGFVIHHIDEDRSNNEIQNLLMMPAELHTKWHSIKQRCGRSQMMKTLDYMFDLDNNHFFVIASMLEKYMGVRIEVQEWISEKQFMDYMLKNKAVME